MNVQPLFVGNKLFCPINGRLYPESEYLKSVIEDEKVCWFVNMITVYRHNFITSWNKCWGDGGGRYRSKWFGNYDDEKRKVNERAKRQIIRKCKHYMMAHGINVSHIIQLQYNETETIALATKLLPNIENKEGGLF